MGADVRVELSSLPSAVVAELEGLLTFANPEYAETQRQGRRVQDVPQRLYYARRDRQFLVLPRGASTTLRSVVVKHGGLVKTLPEVVYLPPEEGAPDHLPADALEVQGRPYQVEAENKLLTRLQGYVVLPCGGGKTTLGVRAMLRSRQPGLVLVHTQDLADQWAATMLRIGRDPRRVRVVGAGRGSNLRPLKDYELAVATVQTLVRAGDRADALLRSVGVLLVDEAHHVPSATMQSVVSRCPARYRWGLTATPRRPDGLDFILPLLFGPQLYALTASDLVQKGYLVLPRVLPVLTGWAPVPNVHYQRDGRLDYSAAMEGLSLDDARNDLVVRLVKQATDEGRTSLVLVQRIDHARILYRALSRLGVEVAEATGEVDKDSRAARIRALRQGRVSCLVATQLADEGLDVPTLDLLVLAAPSKAQGRAVQRVGRLMRPSEGKGIPVVVDLVDAGPLRAQWRSRSEAYQREVGAIMLDAVAAERAPQALALAMQPEPTTSTPTF